MKTNPNKAGIRIALQLVQIKEGQAPLGRDFIDPDDFDGLLKADLQSEIQIIQNGERRGALL